MNFYVISGADNGRDEVSGMYYLVSDKGQYLDSVFADTFDIAFEKLCKKELYTRKYGDICYFYKITDTTKSAHELKMLQRIFKPRKHSKHGNLMPKPDPYIPVKKPKPRRKYTEEELALRESKRKYVVSRLCKRRNWERTHNQGYYQFNKENQDGTVQEIQTDKV